MKSIRFFFEEDLNNEYNIWELLYEKYINVVHFLNKVI